jgi:hypothetical protein
LRAGALPWFRRFVDIAMMAAAVAFTLQGTFIAQSATGSNSHYHPGYAQNHANKHIVAHVHADGTVHKHPIDDGARALNDHLREPGCPCCWNMAVMVGPLPIGPTAELNSIAGNRLAIERSDPNRGIEPDGPRRPPRPPGIA